MPRDPAYHPLVRSVATGLRRQAGVPEGAAVLLAVSGGADSVALLRAVHGLSSRRRFRYRVVVGHVDHRLRAESAQDAEFVAALAKTMGLEHKAEVLVGLAESAAEPGNLYAKARRARYAALGRLARQSGCAFVATAHHADDHMETLLMRLARGTTAKGLRGIAWRRALPVASEDAPDAMPLTLVRPMLGATRAEVADYLQQLGQAWREDASNRDPRRARALLRREVLPAMRQLNPKAAHHARRLSDTLSPRPEAMKP